MLFHWRQDTQVALHPSGVVITDIALNHLDEILLSGKPLSGKPLSGKPLSVIAFPLQDTPEALHGTVVNAMRHTRHTLCQTSLLKFMMEYSIGVLKASVTMEQGMGIRVSFNSLSIISPL